MVDWRINFMDHPFQHDYCDFLSLVLFYSYFYNKEYILNLVVISSISWIIHNSITFLLLNSGIVFWISFFSTMSFSGYTMATNPREIQNEYPTFRKINLSLIIVVIVLIGLNILFFLNYL